MSTAPTDTDCGQPEKNGHNSFVFGERLEDRVTIIEQSSLIHKKVIDEPLKQKVVESNEKEGPRKRPFEVLTGEEDESNVLQIHGKLYQWETSEAVWREKGNGSLKLLDRMKDGKLCSRLGKNLVIWLDPLLLTLITYVHTLNCH